MHAMTSHPSTTARFITNVQQALHPKSLIEPFRASEIRTKITIDTPISRTRPTSKPHSKPNCASPTKCEPPAQRYPPGCLIHWKPAQQTPIFSNFLCAFTSFSLSLSCSTFFLRTNTCRIRASSSRRLAVSIASLLAAFSASVAAAEALAISCSAACAAAAAAFCSSTSCLRSSL